MKTIAELVAMGCTARTYTETFARHYRTGEQGTRVVREWTDRAGNVVAWNVVGS